MNYHLSLCHVAAILHVCWIKIKSLLCYRVNELICHEHVHSEYEDIDQYGPHEIPSELMPCYSYPAGLLNQKENPLGVIELMSSSGINYVLNEYDDFDQYSPYAISSELMLRLVIQSEISIGLLCWRARAALSMNILTNMARIKYLARATPQEWWIYWIHWLSYHVNNGWRDGRTDTGDNNLSIEEVEG